MKSYARLSLTLTVTFALSSLLLLQGVEANRASHKKRADNKKSRSIAASKSNLVTANNSILRVPQGDSPTPIVSQAVAFGISQPVSEMPEKAEVSESMRHGKVEANEERPEKNISPALSGHEDIEGAGPSFHGSSSSPLIGSPLANFEGIINLDNNAHPAIGGLVNPPDTVGDVGPTQYVQAVNLLFRVFNKAGAPVTPTQPISALFAALGPPCSNTDDGDPIVLYDSLADRWIITQFMVSGAAPLSQCIAVSQTGNAAGAYYAYRFVYPNSKFNDYPKFGVWPNGYYASFNQFNLAGTAFLGVGVIAYDRAKMLAGDPTASFIFFDLETTNPNARGMLPSDADGLVPPPTGAPNVFAYFNANEFAGDLGDSLRLFNFNANFANPGSSTFTERADSPVPVAAFNPLNPTGLDDIEQPPPSGATSALDAIQDRLMNRLQYRNFGGYESLITNHTVNVGTGTTIATHQAGVRYYALRRTLPAGTWTVNEQATQAPDTNNRWMGSAAMDNQGNLAVGYSTSSTTVFPSIRYAGRLAGDPPGGLFQGEATMQAGAGVQTNTGSRWGDYSSMNVDPIDDCTFWYTQEYYASTDATPGDFPFGANWQTRIGSFKVNPTCQAPAQGTLQVNVTNCATGLPVAGAGVSVDGNLYGTSLAGGSFSTQLPPGTYTVSAAATNYTPGSSSGVVITNGNTTVVNLCITPVPVIAPDGSALTAESCSPATNVIDPNETVTVDLTLKNTGTADTSNLVATLLATGGVTSPSGPQNYGAVIAGGLSVTRSFTFTADSSVVCGDNIIATLQLQDGANNLGTISYNFTTGALSAPMAAITYSSGNIAVPINDLTTVDIPISVSDVGVVDDINVRVRLNHTFDGDVEISLLHPDGTVRLLSDNRGGSGDNYGTGANDCSGAPTTLDDEAGATIASGVAPFSGSFRPDAALSGFDGKASNGTWKLRVADTANIDTGTVGCVQLEIVRRIRLCCPFAGGTADIDPAPPATITAESCSPANNAIDPEETVTVDIPLRNVGTGATTNLVATLLAGGGITPQSGPQSYGALPPVGPGATATRPFTFVAQGSCGSTVTATFQLQDGATNLGTVTFTFVLGSTVLNTTTYSNNTAITILDTPRVATIAPSSPYPSIINVAGATGTVNKVGVRLKGFGHTFPDDVDVLLVGPGGQKFIVMSDAGLGDDVTNLTIVLDDAAAGLLPDSTILTSGTFRPTNYGTGDTFPAPAPVAPYQSPATGGAATSASVFGGINPNGNWSLYVVDDAGIDAGNITGGWDLIVTTSEPVCCDTPCTLTCPADITVSNDPGQCGANVSYPMPTIDGSCGVVTSSHPSGSFFPVGETTVTLTATRADSSTTTCTFKVTVNDTEPPVITGASVNKPMLWPPNHKMQDVTVNYTSSDNCGGGNCTLSVTSDEPINGLGDGDTSPDWEIVDAHHVRLRAERSGTGDGRVYTITITCTDAAGNSSSTDVTVVVAHNIVGPGSGSAFRINTPVSFAGEFWDIPGRSHTARWLFDGSLSTNGSVIEALRGRLGSSKATYTFSSPGVYQITLNLTDNTGGLSSVSSNGDVDAVVVIYDPSGGYTIGGGWLMAPTGSYKANPGLSGKLVFGFDSKYTKATNPKGETLVKFNLGNFEFNALNYDYMAISGARAQFKGFGKVNGDAGYNFLLTVVDGQAQNGGGVDKFRIKIWHKTSGNVVFDTQMGASEAADPITPVGDGSSIVIQK